MTGERASPASRPRHPLSSAAMNPSDAPVRSRSSDSPTVAAVCRHLEREVAPEDVDLVVHFAAIFLGKASPEVLNERSTDALAHMALGAFRFLQRAQPNRVDVEILNPDIDNEGWYGPVTVMRTSISERPFIVDTIREFLHSQDLAIEHYIYPVLNVERDGDGRIVDIRPPREGVRRESIVHCELVRITDSSTLDLLRRETESRLEDVVRATDDFFPMIRALGDVVRYVGESIQALPQRRAELEEIQAFLRWLRDGALVFLGYRAYDFVDPPGGKGRAVVVEPGSGLGLLRNEAESNYAQPVPLSALDPGMRALAEKGPILIISKTNAESTIHRRARMDYIGIKKLSSEGEILGEHRFLGLFTSRAFGEEAERIPILRQKLRHILETTGVQEGSHDYKEINTIFHSLPKEELFLASADRIGADIQTVLRSYDTSEVRVAIREDAIQRGTSIMIILPKERFSGEVRRKIESALVDRFEGEVLNYHLVLGSGHQARLHFHLAVPREKGEPVTEEELEGVVGELIRSWVDRCREGLERVWPPDEARRLARWYGEAFSAEYRAATPPHGAVGDIMELEAMKARGHTVSITLSNSEEAPWNGGERVTELKLYLRESRLVLSDFMPILENAGLRVIGTNPFEVRGPGVPDAVIYTFAVQDSEGEPLDMDAVGGPLADTLLAVREGDASNDALNALVPLTGLSWREVDVLRAYASYAFQLGAVPSGLSLPVALKKYPEIAVILFELFHTKFDPDGATSNEDRVVATRRIELRLREAMGRVTLLADDRALRRFHTLIRATLRTNYFRGGGRSPVRRSGGVPYVSFKFDCDALKSIRSDRLRYEVWVHSSRMEGIHLRGAKVARGGIRYSDRPDDFRTEVLGLVETQMVKNAVIVPAGSKGGFITLRSLPDPKEMGEEVREQYKTLIRGLLDITDNLDPGGAFIPPRDVLCYDPPDPYLVVAADKGTAHLSDTANEVADDYGFWLGDAFASGGSFGYDHKTVGITAGGVWECVKRHFKEMGKNIQEEDFTAVGIGDMSGDVFGNGMLLSRRIRLVAAFDHRHIFIDPTPDPESSYQERKRLFELPRSSWDDYDRALLSDGGMIVPRGTKKVRIDSRVRSALGIRGGGETLDGESLIRAVLSAEVELLWNGGIGTYVKASDETHADAGDAANQAVRIDATELRAKVVGEGGNRGFTQRARVEYALRGGRINTDAIDNSGGVDLSDREVNLKILLNSAVAAREMTFEERNGLLSELTDSVAALALGDNRSQSLAVSLDAMRTREGVDDFRDLMSALERKGSLDRNAEDLPSWELLVERVAEGRTLTRPELSVLLAYSKLDLMSQLLQSPLPHDAVTERYLLNYFPSAVRKRVGPAHFADHRLRLPIVANQLTNDLVNMMGTTFVQRVSRDTRSEPWEVARAWLVAARLAGHRAILARLHASAEVIAVGIGYRWLLGLTRVLERTARWLLGHVTPEMELSAVIGGNLGGLAALRREFGGIVSGQDREIFEARVGELEELGADRQFAESLITLRFLDQLLDILRVAKETSAAPLDTARVFYRLSEMLHVPWLRRAVDETAGDDRWEQQAAQAMTSDLTDAHHRLATTVMAAQRSAGGIDDAIDRVIRPDASALKRYQGLLQELRDDDEVSLSGLTVAVREIARLARQFGNGAQVGGASGSSDPASEGRG